MRLPDKDEILSACRGMAARPDHPMLDAAGKLAAWHERRVYAPASVTDDLASVRVHLMRDIDRWVSLSVPVPFPTCPMHTESVGQVVDRLGELTIQAFVALARRSPALFQETWIRLDEAGDEYQDLIDALATGTRRLPGSSVELW